MLKTNVHKEPQPGFLLGKRHTNAHLHTVVRIEYEIRVILEGNMGNEILYSGGSGRGLEKHKFWSQIELGSISNLTVGKSVNPLGLCFIT